MLEVLDTAGQEEYARLRDQWISGGQAFMLVCSITSRSSFTHIQRLHGQVMRVKESQPDQNPPVCLVGNKSDNEAEREVSTQEGFVLGKDLGCDFFEVSSKNCVNVEASFYGLVRAMRKRRASMPIKPESPRILKDAAALSPDRRRFKAQN